MNRKKLFCILWASVFLTRLWFEGIGTLVGPFIGSAIEGFSLPGWMLVAALGHVAPSVTAAHAMAIAVCGAVAFWFFPLARICRWFGVFDPFDGSKRSRPRLAGAAVWLGEQASKRLFGRERTGRFTGWIGMVASGFRHGDFFAGRVALFGRFGTLWPVGIKPEGQAVTIGMPGSGKSTAAAIPAVLLHPGSVLCFDPKGEIAQRCYAARGAGGGGVKGRGDAGPFVVDPTNLTKLPRSCFNPLYEIEQEPDPDNAARMVFNLAEGIVKNPGGENSWVYTGARDAAIMLVGYVLATRPPEKRNLLTVRRLLQEGDKDAYAEDVAAKVPGIEKLTPFDVMLLRMQRLPDGPYRDSVAGQAANLEKMGDRQRGSVLSALADATIWLDLVQFQEATASSDFLLRDFQSKQISAFIVLPLNELTGIAGGFMRMFLVMFTDMMYRAPKPPKTPVLCLVDEFAQFGYIDRFCAIGPTMRSYGVKLWVLLQDLGQLKAIYPKEWESFLGCSAMTQYMSVQHGETVDYLVQSLGERELRVRDPATGRVAKVKYPLLDREQVPRFLAARDGNQIVVRYNRRPLRLKTAPYFWYLPFWMYSPDPLHPEPWLRRKMRERAVRKAAEAEAKQRPVGKGVRHDARSSA